VGEPTSPWDHNVGFVMNFRATVLLKVFFEQSAFEQLRVQTATPLTEKLPTMASSHRMWGLSPSSISDISRRIRDVARAIVCRRF